MLETQQEQTERIETELGDVTSKIEHQREENQRLSQSLDEKRTELQNLRGRHASLDALQQAALGQQDDAEMQWLEQHGLGQNVRLGEQIRVDDEWALAVETVLGDYLQAVTVDDLSGLTGALDDFAKGSLNFLDKQVGGASPQGDQFLSAKVTSDIDLTELLAGVKVASSLTEALQMRGGLQTGDSVITLRVFGWAETGYASVKIKTQPQVY